MALRRKVDDDIRLGDQAIHQLGIANIALHEVDLLAHSVEIMRVGSVCHLVDDRDLIFRLVMNGIMHEVRANEPRTTGDKQFCHRFIIQETIAVV